MRSRTIWYRAVLKLKISHYALIFSTALYLKTDLHRRGISEIRWKDFEYCFSNSFLPSHNNTAVVSVPVVFRAKTLPLSGGGKLWLEKDPDAPGLGVGVQGRGGGVVSCPLENLCDGLFLFYLLLTLHHHQFPCREGQILPAIRTPSPVCLSSYQCLCL